MNTLCETVPEMTKSSIQMTRESFLYDSTLHSKPNETVMDYVISWTLRRAQEKHSCGDKRLFEYCRCILCKLIGKKCSCNISFSRVKTWKQEENIDIWTEVDLVENGIKEKHAILIEDKVYDPIRGKGDSTQLEEYKAKFDKHYKCDTDVQKHYVLITCIKREDPKFKQYLKCGFTVFSVYDLHNQDLPCTSSDIFNEFWKYL